jgi:bacteriocin-like protein
METTMSMTNDTPNLAHATQDRELQDDELNAVSGGLVVISIISVLIS